MQALILAAGRGSRMGERTSELPKCLLEIGGRPLIDHMLEALAESGVGPVAVVTGYRGDEVQAVVGIRAEVIENPRWSRTNSVYSFWLAREWVSGPVMVLNSDLLLDRRILERMAASGGNALAFDSSSGDAAEQMKLEVSQRELVRMSKSLPVSASSGENIGVLTFDGASGQRLFDLAGEIIDGGGENQWLGSAVSRLAEETPIRTIDMAGLPWSEIDFPFDLDRARKDTWPRIQQGRSRWSHFSPLRAVSLLAAGLALMLIINLLALRPAPAVWEPLQIDAVETLTIRAGHREQRWWRLERDQTAQLRLVGPAQLRIHSRPLLARDVAELRYALDIAVDGVGLDWDTHISTPSRGWEANAGVVGKKDHLDLELPEGEHRVDIRLVAPHSAAVLVRVTQAVDEHE